MLELGDGVLQRSHRKNFPHHHLQIEKFVERHVFHFRTICRTGYLPDDILEISELFDMLRVVNEFSAQEESLIRKLIDGPEDCLQFFSYLPEIKSLFNIQIQGDRRFFKKVPQYGASLNTTTNTSFHRSPTPPNNIPLQNLDQRSSSISKASNASFALPEQNMNSTRSSSGQNYQFSLPENTESSYENSKSSSQTDSIEILNPRPVRYDRFKNPQNLQENAPQPMVMVQRQVEKALENMNFSVVEHNSVENEKEEEIEQYDSIPGDDEVDEEPISELPVSSQALISISDESTFQRPVLNNVSFASSFEKFDSETTNTDKRSISEASQLEQDQFAPETPIVEIRNGEMDRRAFPTFQLPKITESQSLPMMQESSSESQRMYQREKNLKAQLLKAEMENLQLREKISRRTNESIAGIDSVLESGIYGVTMQQLLDTFSNLKSSLLEIEHVLRPAQETNQSASKPPVFALPPMVEYAPVPTGYAPNFPGPSGQYQSFPAPNQYNDPNLMGFQARRPVDDQRWRPAFSNFAQPPRQNHGRRYGFERPRETRKMAQNDFAVLSDMTNGREPCAICLGEMDSNRQNLFRCRQCTKMIHDKCMSQWRQRNNTCVYCRAILL